MHIEMKGDKQGKKILCLPGLFQSGDCLGALSHVLKDCCLVIVTYNAHDGQKKEFKSFAHEMYTLENGLKKLQMTEFDLVLGLNLGGIMALSLVRRGRIKAKKVFVDNLKTCIPLMRRNAYSAHVIALRLFSLYAKCPFSKKHLLLKKFYTKEWAEKLQRNAAYMSFDSIKNMMWDYIRFAIPKDIGFPVRYFYGGADCKRYLRKLYKVYPDADVVIKKGYSHLTFLNKEPSAYAAMLKKYME